LGKKKLWGKRVKRKGKKGLVPRREVLEGRQKPQEPTREVGRLVVTDIGRKFLCGKEGTFGEKRLHKALEE